MNYCGIDVAMKSSYLYITDGQGRIRGKGELPTTAENFRQALRWFIPDRLKLAIEAGNQTAWKSRCSIPTRSSLSPRAAARPTR